MAQRRKLKILICSADYILNSGLATDMEKAAKNLQVDLRSITAADFISMLKKGNRIYSIHFIIASSALQFKF